MQPPVVDAHARTATERYLDLPRVGIAALTPPYALTFSAGLYEDMLDALARIYDIGAKFPKPPQAITQRGAEGASGGFDW